MGNGTTLSLQFPTNAIDWARWVLGAAILGLLYYAFWVLPVEGTASCYVWLTGHWKAVSNYSHGPLIPLIAILVVGLKWDEIRQARLQPMLSGIAGIVVAMAFYWLGHRAGQPRIVVFAFVLLLYGLVISLGGRQLSKLMFFPIVFLLWMIPLNFLDEKLGVPLQHFLAVSSAFSLNMVGIEAVRIGTAVRSTVFDFDVANPCSGLRSLMALTVVTGAFAYVTQNVAWKRWILFLSAIPLALVGNLSRVLAIALVGQVYGRGPAEKMHDHSGFIFFGVALTAMVAFGFLLNLPYRRVIDSWLKPTQSGTIVRGPLTPVLSEETHE